MDMAISIDVWIHKYENGMSNDLKSGRKNVMLGFGGGLLLGGKG